MKKNRLDRREFLKLEAAAMAAAAGGMPTPLAAQNLVTDRSFTELRWNKAPCRFCGTGCGVMVATKDGRVVATHGDTKAEVNRGLNCVKGYFLSKIMYGHDRLTHPLLRKKDGKYHKNGELTQVSWDEAFDVMAQQFKAALAKRGTSGVGMFGYIGRGSTKLGLELDRLNRQLREHRSLHIPLEGAERAAIAVALRLGLA